MSEISHPYKRTGEEILAELGVEQAEGLSQKEAGERLLEVGPNKLQETQPRGSIQILLSQFKSSVVALLAVAAALSFLFGDNLEGFAIGAVIAINAAIGFFTELSATRSMEALYRLGSVSTRVRRAGGIHEVEATDLVPGDIVLLEGGDIVTADLRFLETSKVQCDESALTGESIPVSKQVKPIDGDPPLAERVNMAFKGTSVSRGAGEAVVVATGMETELGRISSLVAAAEEEITPLEKRLGALGRKLVWVILTIAIVISVFGILRGKDEFLMVQMGIALAVASIPEGLPIVATIALSRGLLRMARRKALVRQLSSVETLGSANIICTDKTGTLTENRMTATRLELTDGFAERTESGEWSREGETATPSPGTGFYEALKICGLCNNSALDRAEDGTLASSGDPLEVALLLADLEAGLDADEIRESYGRLREESFESETKMMATYHEDPDGGVYVAVKGAPEVVLGLCDKLYCGDTPPSPISEADRAAWLARNNEFASEGFRLVAVASKTVGSSEEEPYAALTFVGLVCLLDPPREDIRPSLELCRQAGIRVVMVTGDQGPTALYVAKSLGIVGPEETACISGADLRPAWKMSEAEEERVRDANVFARVNPEQKLDLVALHQKHGDIVAMTGDGVNDAPALKKADIGVAMGLRGTQVAREVADVVLKDDSFQTIVYAIQEGRVIFGNIRKFVLYLLSCNMAEIMVIFFASFANSPLPILPLQILFLNLVTDVFPALALGVGEGNPRVMDRPPRPTDEPILTRRMWAAIGGHGLVIAISTLLAFFIAYEYWGLDSERAVTISFLTLAAAQLWHVLNMRDRGASLIRNDVTRNRFVWAALALCVALLAMAVYLPGLSEVLDTVPLTAREWVLVGGMSLAPLLLDGIVRKVIVR